MHKYKWGESNCDGGIRADVTSNKTSGAHYEVRKSPNILSVCRIKAERLDCEKPLESLINLQIPQTGLYYSLLLKCKKYDTLPGTHFSRVVENHTHTHMYEGHMHFPSSVHSSVLAKITITSSDLSNI